MADVASGAACEACGRGLPPQRGRGRKRRYCNATCRSAARREREPQRVARGSRTQDDADGPAAPSPDQKRRAGLPGPAGRVSLRAAQAARHLSKELEGGGGSPLAAVAAARELTAAANEALQAAVDRARAEGYSWRDIGDILDTSRQAAFQRFGRPVDPRTGRPMTRAVPPGAIERAVALFTCVAEGRWEEARRDFGDRMRQGLDADKLAGAWAAVAGMIGAFERMGDPLANPVPDGTVVDVPLYFEAGERTGRVGFDDDLKVVGFFIRPALQ